MPEMPRLLPTLDGIDGHNTPPIGQYWSRCTYISSDLVAEISDFEFQDSCGHLHVNLRTFLGVAPTLHHKIQITWIIAPSIGLVKICYILEEAVLCLLRMSPCWLCTCRKQGMVNSTRAFFMIFLMDVH